MPRPQLPAAEPGGGPDAAHALLGNTTLVTDTGEAEAPLYDREALLPGNRIDGPVVLAQTDSTTFLPPNWAARVDSQLNLILERVSP